MNIHYATRLEEFSQTNSNTYQQVLNDHEKQILDVFGGLDTMIHLCLINPQFSTDQYESQFNSFKSLMESNNIHIENEFESDVIIKYNNESNEIIETISSVTNKNDNVILSNIQEFHKYSLVIVAYYSDNVYFIFLPTATAKYIFDRMLHTKVYPVCCTIVFIVFKIAAQTYMHFVAHYDAIYYCLMILANSVVIVSCLTYILSANISIVAFVVQTFDFWYKMYNMVLWIVSSYYVMK